MELSAEETTYDTLWKDAPVLEKYNPKNKTAIQKYRSDITGFLTIVPPSDEICKNAREFISTHVNPNEKLINALIDSISTSLVNKTASGCDKEIWNARWKHQTKYLSSQEFSDNAFINILTEICEYLYNDHGCRVDKALPKNITTDFIYSLAVAAPADLKSDLWQSAMAEIEKHNKKNMGKDLPEPKEFSGLLCKVCNKDYVQIKLAALRSSDEGHSQIARCIPPKGCGAMWVIK